MNEADKRKIKAFVAKTGKKVFDSVKLKSGKSKIVPYDGDDAYYIDIQNNPEGDDFVEKINVTVNGEKSDVIEKGSEAIKKIVDDVKSRIGKVITTEDDTENGDGDTSSDVQVEKPKNSYSDAIEYFKTISSKLDGLKAGITDAINHNKQSDDAKSSTKLDEYMNDVNERLFDINALIEKGMSDLSASTGDIKSEVNSTKDRYDEISQSIKTVSKSTEENVEKISELSDNIDGVKNRVNEIHSTTNSIDKLYDSVFELKSVNAELKASMEKIQEKSRKNFIIGIIAVSIAAVLAVVDVVINFI